MLLAIALAAMVAVQLALPADTALPAAGSVARLGDAPPPADPAQVAVPQVLADGAPFAPVAHAGSSAQPDPLNGSAIAGVVQRGKARLALVQGPDRAFRYVAPGADIAGWRLVALGPQSARLQRGEQHIDLPYGARAIAPAAPANADSSE